MKLHQDKEAFKELIEVVAEDIGLLPFQIEKDYYVSLVLKEISKSTNISIVFKGGTSLSKCYDVVDRFSEDVDLAVSFEEERLSRERRRKLKEVIKDVINELNFIFLNERQVESNKDYNKYEVGYEKMFSSSETMADHIIVETLVVYKPYPCEKRDVSNYITNYLKQNNRLDLIEQYELEPFKMKIQTIERTFIDKVFAICDYHLLNKYIRNSRHIYDLYKIWNSNILNIDVVKSIMDDVIKDRQLLGVQNLSCLPGVKPKELLKEIYDKDVYEVDYNEITLAFIHKPVDYIEAIKVVNNIVEAKLLPESIQDFSE
jgi:predicted nucleotidyltransferase component of viral defense system